MKENGEPAVVVKGDLLIIDPNKLEAGKHYTVHWHGDSVTVQHQNQGWWLFKKSVIRIRGENK